MSRMLSGTPLFPGMGLSGGEESGCAEPGFGSYVKNLIFAGDLAAVY